MYSLNRKISRKFQEPVFKEIVSTLQSNDVRSEKYKYVGRIHNFALMKLERTLKKYKSIRYVLMDQEEFHCAKSKVKKLQAIKGYLFLEIKNGYTAAHVDISFLCKELRGLGIGKKLYKHAIFKDNIFMMSGKLQTPLSQRLWKSFINDSRLFVWAQDLNLMRNKCQVEIYNNELHCDLDIWYNDRNAWENRDKDIRLFAIPARLSQI